jgi:hypothetical protein
LSLEGLSVASQAVVLEVEPTVRFMRALFYSPHPCLPPVVRLQRLNIDEDKTRNFWGI